MSQPVPSMPSGEALRRISRRSGSMSAPPTIGVSTGPGAMQLTRTPWLAWSTAIARESAITAPLEAE